MARKDRTGNRKTREQRKQFKVPELGYYLIVTDTEATVTFGGYANPSFEAQIETVGKAKTSGIMSIEASIDELYGDTKDEKWKLEEVKRIKNENGIVEMEEPAIAQDIDLIENNADMEGGVSDDGE